MLNIAFFSPLPPIKSGISDYSADILNEISNYFNIDVFIDGGYTPTCKLADNISVFHHNLFKRERYDNIIYQFGDASYHDYMKSYMQHHPGIVVMHDQDQNSINLITNSTNSIIVHSQVAKETVLENNAGLRVKTIPHYATIKPLPDSYEAKQKCSINPSDLVIAYFGFLATRKRARQVAKAFALCAQKHSNIQLIFVGGNVDVSIDDILDEFRQSGIIDRITITGFIDDVDTFCDYIDASDICVNLRYPEYGESSGSLMRYLSKGRAIITTDIGSFAEIPDACCLKIPPPADMDEHKEVQMISDAMLSLIENKELRTQLQQNARLYAEKNLDIKKIGKQYADEVYRVTTSRNKNKSTMKIIIAATIIPFSENADTSIVDELKETLISQNHQVNVVYIPISTDPVDKLSQMKAVRLYQIRNECDLLICLDLFSALIPHPNKYIWLINNRCEYTLQANGLILSEARKVFISQYHNGQIDLCELKPDLTRVSELEPNDNIDDALENIVRRITK